MSLSQAVAYGIYAQLEGSASSSDLRYGADSVTEIKQRVTSDRKLSAELSHLRSEVRCLEAENKMLRAHLEAERARLRAEFRRIREEAIERERSRAREMAGRVPSV